MYEELIVRLRSSADGIRSCDECNGECNGTCIFAEAADAIEELQKELLDKRNEANNDAYDVGYWAGRRDYEPKWISVKERLPENKRETYLILTDSGYECDARWTDNIYGLRQSDRWGWCFFDIPQYSKVTHWMPRMPLPETPKEDKP